MHALEDMLLLIRPPFLVVTSVRRRGNDPRSRHVRLVSRVHGARASSLLWVHWRATVAITPLHRNHWREKEESLGVAENRKRGKRYADGWRTASAALSSPRDAMPSFGNIRYRWNSTVR